MVTAAPQATAAAHFIVSSRHYRQQQLLVSSNTVAHLYNPSEDGWVQVPSPALAGTFGAGACGVAGAFSTGATAGASFLTATAGTTTTITTNQTLASFKRYDFSTNTWVTLVNTGLPASWGTDGRLCSSPAWLDTGFKSFATGTATAGASTTLTNSAKAWTTNQWTNYQIRITAGTGAGQIRTVASNTGTVITVSSAWTTTPDATSQYSLEGNDDFIYALGNNAVTMYRYSISGNTWSTLSPGVARGGAPTTGMSGNWIHSVSASDWTNENAILNGRYIYSFRGAGGALLDRYDIAANSWAALTYSPAVETFTTGTKWAYCKDAIYAQKDATGRWFRYDIAQASMDGWTTMLYPNGSAVLGDTSFDVTYRDGATEIDYIHMVLNTSAVHLRQMVI
jgi:hypothetical protein